MDTRRVMILGKKGGLLDSFFGGEFDDGTIEFKGQDQLFGSEPGFQVGLVDMPN